MATHNPAASVGGHVAVDLDPLAEVPVDGDGVDAAQCVSVHQVLGAVLWVSKDTAACKIKKKKKRLNLSKATPFPHVVGPTGCHPGKV